MKAEDLMIGNLIHSGDKIIRVTEIRNNELPELGYKGSVSGDVAPWLATCSGIPLSEEWLIKMGFEKKKAYGWKGNGYDYQPETSKTEYQDYVLNIDSETDFIVRYSTSSYRKDEECEWVNELSISIHKGRWYQKVNEVIPCIEIQYVHQLQNLYHVLTQEYLTIL